MEGGAPSTLEEQLTLYRTITPGVAGAPPSSICFATTPGVSSQFLKNEMGAAEPPFHIWRYALISTKDGKDVPIQEILFHILGNRLPVGFESIGVTRPHLRRDLEADVHELA